MDATDKDKLDLIGAILPVMAELRRFYALQWSESQKALEDIDNAEEWVRVWAFLKEESAKTSRRLHGLAGVSRALIDEVCESLGVAYHEFTDGIIDEDESDKQ